MSKAQQEAGGKTTSSLSPCFDQQTQTIDSVCIGSGRFLRSVLVPALVGADLHPAIVQTRGRTFLDYCLARTSDLGREQDVAGADASAGTLTYEVDTVNYDGTVVTAQVGCYGAGTLGTQAGRDDVTSMMDGMDAISVIGVGVTEAGLSSATSPSLRHLADILRKCHERMMSVENPATTERKRLVCPNPNGRICIINTDNVPGNGSVLRKHLLEIASLRNNDDDDRRESSFVKFLTDGVAFHDTMVDRITSQRDGSDGLVPRCEPVPVKAMVVEDLGGDLPLALGSEEIRSRYGVVVRTKPGQLESDIALKLRVANGTHTAVAHVMALSSLPMTDVLSSSNDNENAALLMQYLDSYFSDQILPAARDKYGADETGAVYDDWRRRLCHPHFGLSSFFITQNGAAKGGIRIGPTVRSLLSGGMPVSVSTSFAMAAILRFLTPAEATAASSPSDGIYRGWLDGSSRPSVVADLGADGRRADEEATTVAYADGLRYNFEGGWYEFRCGCNVCVGSGSSSSSKAVPICEALASLSTPPRQPHAYADAVRAYLSKEDGGGLSDVADDKDTSGAFDDFVMSVCTLYARMAIGDGMLDILREMREKQGVYADGLATNCKALVDGVSDDKMGDRCPLFYRESPVCSASRLLTVGIGRDATEISSVIFGEVAAVSTVDLHTHLLPPSYGALCLWGIDELLTYHYLVAEYFMTAPSEVTPEGFYARSKREQADLVWKALFIERSPVSEACRGVITSLQAFGLTSQVQGRDLEAIREFYDEFRNDGLAGSERFCERVFRCAGVRYAIMTNIPFDANEAQHWRPKRKEYPDQFRSALRVDPLLAGDRKTVEAALKAYGYGCTLEGARQYLRDWCDTMKPEYMMASTPHNFVLQEGKGNLSGVKKVGVNEDAMKEPFAFVDVAASNTDCANNCDGEEDATASVINEGNDFLSEVLMKICEERDLPLALKIGAHRGVNAKLLQAGDGVVAFADGGVLARLCSRFPRVRFLATFLSRNNQHEACVLASKFRNLHVYGCWWFCNNPSMIKEITKMRVEMLGTAFTAQHSDARVMDQLIYKWSHSRGIIAAVLAKEYHKLSQSGWMPTRGELRRDVERLFGGSYEEFMCKSFIA